MFRSSHFIPENFDFPGVSSGDQVKTQRPIVPTVRFPFRTSRSPRGYINETSLNKQRFSLDDPLEIDPDTLFFIFRL